MLIFLLQAVFCASLKSLKNPGGSNLLNSMVFSSFSIFLAHGAICIHLQERRIIGNVGGGCGQTKFCKASLAKFSTPRFCQTHPAVKAVGSLHFFSKLGKVGVDSGFKSRLPSVLWQAPVV